jgi:CHAT domain-containing protein
MNYRGSRYMQGLLVIVTVAVLVMPGFAGRGLGPLDEGQKSSRPGAMEEGESGPSKFSPATAQTSFQQARELARAGKFQEALPLAEKALAFCEKQWGPDDPKTAGALELMGNIHMGLLQRRKAIALYQRALAIREKGGPETPDTARILARLGKAYTDVGEYAPALPLLERSVKIRERVLGPEHQHTAESLGILAELQRQMGAHDKALPLAQQSLAIREKVLGGTAPETASSLAELALIYQQQGDLQKALPLAERALAIREKTLGPQHPLTARSQALVAMIHAGRKDFAQAEAALPKEGPKPVKDTATVEVYLAQKRYQAALDILSASPPHPAAPTQFLALYYTQKGQALEGLGRLGEAAASYAEAMQTIENLRARTPGERTGFFQGGRLGGHYKTYQAMIGVLAAMAQKGEPLPAALKSYGADPAAAAFFVAESMKARSLLEAIAAKAGKGAGEALPGDLVAQERTLQDQLAALEAKRAEIFQPHRRMQRDVTAFQAEVKAVQDKQQALVEELRRRAPRYAALYYPRPYKASEVPLRSGEILLEYSLGERESHLFRVEPGGKTKIFRLATGQGALDRKISALLAPFRQSGLRREDLNRFTVSAGAALYQELLEPALAGVAPGTRLIIVPDGVLGAFPFEALVVEGKSDWGKSVLVGDRWPVTYSQSAAILALNRHLGLSRAPQPLFALGDCIYEKTSPRFLAYKGGQGQAGELKHAGPEKALTMSAAGDGGGQLQFPPLPETRKTVTELAALFQVTPKPPQVLLDVQATETRVRQAPLAQFRYLFFGTHGFLADNLRGVQEPTLVLSQVENQPPDNGFLTFHKVLQLKLDADLVTLAACMTGVGQVTQGEGVLNFSRAFQQAGARSVMVTLWNIPVEESLLFYNVLYKGLKQGKTKLQAMQAARQAVRAKEPHPYFWSGLILHGEG